MVASFLARHQKTRDVFEFITSSTRHWTSDIGKEAASKACMWARSACTADACDPDTSALAICINMDEGDTETISWATQHLQGYLPAPNTVNPTLTPTELHNNSSTNAMVMMAQQTMQMAQSLINHDMDHTNPTHHAPKQLPEDIICHLLGLCGLTWDNRNQLPKIWQSLQQQADQKG